MARRHEGRHVAEPVLVQPQHQRGHDLRGGRYQDGDADLQPHRAGLAREGGEQQQPGRNADQRLAQRPGADVEQEPGRDPCDDPGGEREVATGGCEGGGHAFNGATQ